MLIEVHQGRIQIMPAPKALLKLQKAKSLLSQNMSVFEPEIIHFSGKYLPQVSKAPVCFIGTKEYRPHPYLTLLVKSFLCGQELNILLSYVIKSCSFQDECMWQDSSHV